MSVVCTFPGKFGDLLWALPTMRAVAETINGPVDLIVSEMLRPILPLLEQQSYIGHVMSMAGWQIEYSAPVSPRVPAILDRDDVIHLGLEEWPHLPIPLEIFGIAEKQVPVRSTAFDLERPWITTKQRFDFDMSGVIAVGFTDEWFELKYGIYQLLLGEGRSFYPLFPEGSRWDREGGCMFQPTSFVAAAQIIREASVFVGCCAALHVLACAMGKPTIVVEPNPHRHHPIFWPEIDRIHQVRGGDGRPTFDARHVREAIEKVAARIPY